MTSGAEGQWVRQGTPRDDNADWNQEQSEYGSAMSPTEWDDYSSEQSVPVAAPRAQMPEGTPTAASPDTPSERDHEPVPGQEPDSEEEYRSDETGTGTSDEPAGDADDSGLEPVHIDPPEQQGSTAVVTDADADVSLSSDSPVDEEEAATTRPRPVVPDVSMAAVDAMDPVVVDDAPEPVDRTESPDAVPSPAEEVAVGDEVEGDLPDEDDDRHLDAAEYLATDPVPASVQAYEDEAVDEDASPSAPADDVFTPDDDGITADESVADVDGQESDEMSDQQNRDVDDDDMEATQAVPVTVVAADPATDGTVPDGLYRADGAEPTAVIAEDTYPDVDVEEERLQARLDAERQAREQRLGAVATSSDNASREDFGPVRVTTDRFFPSLSLFVLRLVTASILGLTSWQILGSGVDATANYLGGFPLIPEPRLVAWILGFTLGALALLLVIGLLQRFAGFLLLVVAVAALTFIRWGNFSIFTPETAGFLGDKDLLLAAVGLVLLGMGGGRWGIDGAFRASRAASKAESEG